MTPALLDPPDTLALEERLEAVWQAAQRDEPAECPVCQAAMHCHGGVAGCDGCGARLT